jgi:hypothetical protein
MPHHGQRCWVYGIEKKIFDVTFIGSYPIFGFMTEDSELPNVQKNCIAFHDIDYWMPYNGPNLPEVP